MPGRIVTGSSVDLVAVLVGAAFVAASVSAREFKPCLISCKKVNSRRFQQRRLPWAVPSPLTDQGRANPSQADAASRAPLAGFGWAGVHGQTPATLPDRNKLL